MNRATVSQRPTIEHKRAIQNRLLKWFDSKTRNLPWLVKKTPYHIWVSEIMLQQTQITTVIDYYRRFITLFPNVQHLAAADIDQVLKTWEGLGYYRRARQLHAAARKIVDEHEGNFPTRHTDVLALPGIGRYTAAAILSISLDQHHAILEGNTIRLFSRLMLLQADVTKSNSQKMLWQFSEALLPRSRVGDFNQALMDFGREICKPKDPQCNDCPLAAFCPTAARGLQTDIPYKANKIAFENRHEAIVLIQRNQKILMRKCSARQRWAGLWDFPRYDIDTADDGQLEQLSIQIQSTTGLVTEIKSLNRTMKHGVTKYRITLDCYKASRVSGRLKSGGPYQWKSNRELAQLPLNATGRKFADSYL